MDSFGEAWLLDKIGNCIDVYAHPSESFEFESVVDIVSKYGSEVDKKNCEEWKATKSESSKKAILYSYNHNWFKVRLWKDNKLTFRNSSINFDWEPVIAGFLKTHPYLKYASISVSDQLGNRLRLIFKDSDQNNYKKGGDQKMFDMDVTPVYTIMVCDKLEEMIYEHADADGTVTQTPSGYVAFGDRDVVGFFHEKEYAIEAVKANACDINETCYRYAIVEEVNPGIYTRTKKRWIFKYNRELDEYIQIEEPEMLKKYINLTWC